MKLNYRRGVEVNCVNSSELFFTFEEWKQIDKNIDKRKQFCGFSCFRSPPGDKNTQWQRQEDSMFNRRFGKFHIIDN